MTLEPSQRAALSRLADVLLPGARSMPAASEVGVAGRLLDRVLAARPDLEGDVAEVAHLLESESPRPLIERLRGERVSLFRAALLALVGAYYLAPEVLERLGYDGQSAHSIDVFQLPSYFEDGSLDRVVARGPCYADPDVVNTVTP